jgi:hypothetical protein
MTLQHDLNDRAEYIATQRLEQQPAPFESKKCLTAHPGYKVCLLYDNSVITSKFYKTLSRIKHDKKLKLQIL